MKIKYSKLLNLTKLILKEANLDNYSLNILSRGLCDTSLRGVDSHGINLLPDYFNFVKNKRKNPKPNFQFKKTFPAAGVLDANNAFGLVAGAKAVDLGIPIAKKYGVAVISVVNSTHPGALSVNTIRAAEKNFAALCFANADSLMLSYGGKEKYFGSNPYSFACPHKKNEPYCLDMATTIMPWNRLLIAKNNNDKLDGFYAADKNGKKTDNPNIAESLLPFGGYKGYALASSIDILSAIYTGMPISNELMPMYKNSKKNRKLGQLYIILNINNSTNIKTFIKRMKKMSNEIHKSKPISKNIKPILPNDREIKTAKYRTKHGIPIDSATINKIRDIIKHYNIKSVL